MNEPIKPGLESSEFLIVRSVLIGSAVCTALGSALAYWVSAILGVVLIGAAALVASASIVAYSHGRSSIKAAAVKRPPKAPQHSI